MATQEIQNAGFPSIIGTNKEIELLEARHELPLWADTTIIPKAKSQ